MVGNSITQLKFDTTYNIIMVDGTGMIAMVKQSANLVSCPDMRKESGLLLFNLAITPSYYDTVTTTLCTVFILIKCKI